MNSLPLSMSESQTRPQKTLSTTNTPTTAKGNTGGVRRCWDEAFEAESSDSDEDKEIDLKHKWLCLGPVGNHDIIPVVATTITSSEKNGQSSPNSSNPNFSSSNSKAEFSKTVPNNWAQLPFSGLEEMSIDFIDSNNLLSSPTDK
ncbi:hypothetical protein Ocin01_16648 [Orchesella cincta]|uniref:Uncharacterized protein n=1 Tax=Orchesella cincta TaxID=48709 RepID=A0A1D2MAY6_ORCCI|nr:hypothetical protein Ocin01_16648 [Orchesella cincta]